jgi:hypothetical protein
MQQLVADYVARWPGGESATVAEEHLVDEAAPDLVARLLLDFVDSARSAAR